MCSFQGVEHYDPLVGRSEREASFAAKRVLGTLLVWPHCRSGNAGFCDICAFLKLDHIYMELHKVKGFAMITRQTILIAAIILPLSAASAWSGPYWCPDLSGDDFVNFVDFAMLAGNWEQSGNGLAGDFDDSGTVDMNDLDYFVDY